ncbi:MAG: glycosyltransferase family 2 protein [Gaiellales bacterium]
MRELLSIVVPVYNEVESIGELHRRLTAAMAQLGDYELVLVDDGSTDGTWEALRALADGDRRLRLIRLSRNFGHQTALSAGLEAARGDAVVSIDADLQDPPEVIPELVARWREGYDVVYAVRERRSGESRFKLATAALFYKGINRLSAMEIPEQAGDFRLLSRRALDGLLAMPERSRFLRGMSTWIGFRQIGVPYARDPRFAGATKYPLRKMARLATDAVTSFSTAPIRIVVTLGLLAVGFCLAALVWTLYLRLFTERTVQGWTSVLVVLLFLGGVQLVSVGIIGQYVGRIFEEVKGRPLYLVAETIEPERVEE